MADLPWLNDVANGTAAPNPYTTYPSYGLGDLIRDVAPLVTTGLQYATGSSAINNAYSDAAAGLKASADTLKGGYDAKQNIVEAGTDELMQLLTAGLKEMTDKYNLASFGYRDDVRNDVTRYDTKMRPELNNLLQGLSVGNDIYGLQLDQAAGNAEGKLAEGVDTANAELQPFADDGMEAMDYLMQVMSLDPSMLTPDQQKLMEDFSRDLMAGLSASGLRGAGRAGIATVNEGRADLGAKLFAQNQERADRAAQAIADKGFNASNTMSGRMNDLAKMIADLRYKTGSAKAQNTYNVTGDIAGKAFDYGKDVGGKLYAADAAATGNKYDTAKGIGDLTGQYYQGMGNLQANRYDQRASNTFGKAAADSAGLQSVTATQFAGDAARYQNTNNALDSIGAILSRQNKAAVTGQ